MRSRFFNIETAKLDKAARTVELAFSSETPVRCWFGNEVLSHDATACDLSRLQNGANILFNHDMDNYVGVVESARIDPDRKGRAIVRFSTGDLADRVFDDVQTGILRQVSVGYRVHEDKLTSSADGVDTYTATRWEPYEISIVTAAADPSVGVGRSLSPFSEYTNMNKTQRTQSAEADEPIQPAESAQSTPPPASDTRSQGASAPPFAVTAVTRNRSGDIPSVDFRQAAIDIRKMADNYKRTIPNAPELALRAIAEGTTLEAFQGALLNEFHTRTVRGATSSAHVGLDDHDINRFSFVRFLRAACARPNDKRVHDECAFEIEVSDAASRRMSESGRAVRGMVIPSDILANSTLNRGIVSGKTGAGYAGTGNNLVANTYLEGTFQEILRNNCVLVRHCTSMTGLQGTFTLPKQLTGASAGWIGEDDAAPETDVTFGQDTLSHKTVASYTQVTREMLNQPSLDVEAYVRKELALAAAAAIDTAGFYGSGVGNIPKGIKSYAGIPAVTFTGGNPDYANIVAMETAIATANVDLGSKLYIFNASVRGKLKTIKRFAASGSDTVLWEPGGTVNGYPADISEQIASTDMFFGVWSEFIYAVWGGLEILADQIVRNGRIEVSCFQDVNFLLRRPECFCFGDLSVSEE
jgi:HK97 family phage major capsid protein/HK97 family phage prohead protease